MGSGISVNQVMDNVKSSYVKNPEETLRTIKECNKEFSIIHIKSKIVNKYPSEEDIYLHFEALDIDDQSIIEITQIDRLISIIYPQFDNKLILTRAYKAADIHKTGLLDYENYKNLWKYINYYNTRNNKFSKIPFNNETIIDYSEFVNLNETLFEQKLSHEELKHLFNSIDTDNKNTINFEDFCSFMVKRITNINKFKTIINTLSCFSK